MNSVERFDADDVEGNAESERKKRLAMGLLLGCLVVACIFGVMGTCIAKLYFGVAKPSAVTEEYLKIVDSGDYEQAYAFVDGRWREGQSLEEFAELHRAIWGKMGSFHEGRMESISVRDTLEGQVAGVQYLAEFDNGSCKVAASVVENEGEWSIASANFNSPLLKSLFVCIDCGQEHKTVGKDCTSCGKPMGR